MQRFMGMMPSTEIERQEKFKTCFGDSIIIQAGPNGWTVIYADHSTNYKDEKLTTDENFMNAYTVADENVGPLTPVNGERKYEVSDQFQ